MATPVQTGLTASPLCQSMHARPVLLGGRRCNQIPGRILETSERGDVIPNQLLHSHLYFYLAVFCLLLTG